MDKKTHQPLLEREGKPGPRKRLWNMIGRRLGTMAQAFIREIQRPPGQYRLALALATLLSFLMTGLLYLPAHEHVALHLLMESLH